LSELLGAVLCTTVVHNGMHTGLKFTFRVRLVFVCFQRFSLYFCVAVLV